jgi:hypothetical protein
MLTPIQFLKACSKNASKQAVNQASPTKLTKAQKADLMKLLQKPVANDNEETL